MGRNVWLLSGISLAVAIGFGIVSPVLPMYAQQFGANAFLAAAVISAFALMRFVFSPAVGRLVDRLGHRRVLISGLAIVALSSAAAGLATTYAWLIVLRGLGGVGSAMFSVSGMSLLLSSVPASRRGRAAGLYQGGFLVGAMAGPPFGGLFAAISLRAPFFFYALTLGLAVLVALGLERKGEVDSPAGSGTGPDAGVSPAATPLPLRLAVKDRRFQTACLANLVHGWNSHGTRAALIPLFVVATLANSPAQAAAWIGLALMISAALQAALVLPAGWLVDRIGRRWPLVAGTVFCGVGLAAVPWSGSMVWLTLAMCCYAVGAALLGSAPAALVGDAAGPAKDRAVAVYSMCGDFGSIVGPLAAGLMVDQLSFHLAFTFGAGLWLLATIPALTIRRLAPTT
ncbi:MAG: MFS transporter [Micrococcales bacterium]|nr:MFS transporter [Micrococcales bacterium]